eukprot:Colp12_sorted_trinity150504_noHs@30190
MCRFVLYKGKYPILLGDLLTRPTHSIIRQSFDSRQRIDNSPLNGDGFGVGWYDHKRETTQPAQPCIFTSVLPAWNNLNLKRLAESIVSNLVFAHVRAATPGLPTSESNCHPWQYGSFMWMHNGAIASFNKIKRRLQSTLRNSLYEMITGTTDSETAFAVFLNQFEDPLNGGPFTPNEIREALLKTIAVINQCLREENVKEPSTMNFAVTNGETVVCTRYINDAHMEPVSLYFTSGTKFESYEEGAYRMVKSDRREHVVIVASEPLTFEALDWLSVPKNHMLVITPKLSVLQYPIPLDPSIAEPAKPAVSASVSTTSPLHKHTSGDAHATMAFVNKMHTYNTSMLQPIKGTAVRV